MLAKKDLLIQNYMYVGELCWWKFWCMLVKSIFVDEICMLVKDVGEKSMLVKNLCWWKIYVDEIISLKYACWWKLFLYVGEKYVLEKILVFTNKLVFRQHKFFCNMLHQH